ncbi:MAG: hypothetical protein ACI9FR_002831, partial [Cryomorphaceae bacterium]
MNTVVIRPAISSDAATIMQFVIDLAVYEKEPDAVVATEQHVRETLFCEQPQAQSL